MSAPTPDDEARRLAVLRDYAVLDTAPAEILDGLTELAATLCGTPIALITLIDVNRQWFKARYGTQLRETRRDDAFSAHAILQPEMLVVRDAMADARFTADPLVRDELKIRFYAGAPLIAPEGVTLGTLCVIDHRPRDLTSSQKRALQLICDQAMAWLDAQRQGVSRSDAVRTETGSPPSIPPLKPTSPPSKRRSGKPGISTGNSNSASNNRPANWRWRTGNSKPSPTRCHMT